MTIERPMQTLRTETMQQQGLRHGRASCSILLLCVFLTGMAWPQHTVTSYDVEAAYLYNFGKFVRWPADTDAGTAPFTICILGEDPFGQKLDMLIANESVQGRPIVAKRVAAASATEACQIVFLGSSEEPKLAKDLAELQKRPMLTVSNMPDFVERGGMIQFLQINNTVRFEVNLSSAQQSGLALSSELLKVAVTVNTKTAQEVKP